MKLFTFLLLAVMGCATAPNSQRRSDPRDQRRESQSASARRSDFEPHQLRDRSFCDAGCTESR